MSNDNIIPATISTEALLAALEQRHAAAVRELNERLADALAEAQAEGDDALERLRAREDAIQRRLDEMDDRYPSHGLEDQHLDSYWENAMGGWGDCCEG
jgi:uncharacterized protein with beta-barrel porin domain